MRQINILLLSAQHLAESDSFGQFVPTVPTVPTIPEKISEAVGAILPRLHTPLIVGRFFVQPKDEPQPGSRISSVTPTI